MSILIGKFFFARDGGLHDGHTGEFVGPIDSDGFYHLARFDDGTLAVIDISDTSSWILFDTAEARANFLKPAQPSLKVVSISKDESVL